MGLLWIGGLLIAHNAHSTARFPIERIPSCHGAQQAVTPDGEVHCIRAYYPIITIHR
jgi:hypothetical protein